MLDCVSLDDVLRQVTKRQENGFEITASTDLKTGMIKLKSFMNVWMSRVDSNIDVTLVYGLLKLVITVLALSLLAVWFGATNKSGVTACSARLRPANTTDAERNTQQDRGSQQLLRRSFEFHTASQRSMC